MKHNSLFALIALLLASLACNLVQPTPAPIPFPTEAPATAKPTEAAVIVDMPTSEPTAQPAPAIEVPQSESGLPREEMTADDLQCDGTTDAPPCERRKIRIRGWEEAKLCPATRVKGESYSFFPIQPRTSWVTVIHGIPEEGGIGPVGWAYDAGTKFMYDHESDQYYFVTEAGMPAGTFYSIAKSEASCETKSPEKEYWVSISADFCPVKPDGRYSAQEGKTYTFYGINTFFADNKGVQFSILVKFDDPQALIDSNADMSMWSQEHELVNRNDFAPYILKKIAAPYGVWLKDPVTQEIFWAPEMFCDYWRDTQP